MIAKRKKTEMKLFGANIRVRSNYLTEDNKKIESLSSMLIIFSSGASPPMLSCAAIFPAPGYRL
jgi:hypothetical protein